MGASQRASQVVYDRTGAAVTELGAGDVDWPQILLESAWFHTTGITPALSRTVADATREALGAARRLGIPRSIDLNYRRKLWSPAAAQEVMTPLVAEADVLIANEEDAEQVFGIRAGRTDVASGTLDRDRYLDVAGELFAQFPELKVVAITLRESHDAGRNGWSALVAERESHAFARHYELSIVDRVGAGDAFAAGLIHARLSGMDISRTVEFATAAAALKHTIVGDFNRATAAEILALVEGGGSGRVAR
jgi:2-dehydro-3-deoxygluconokinase